jgi:hypothetical protein
LLSLELLLGWLLLLALKLLLLLWWWLSLELLLGRGLTPMALVTRHRHQHSREKNPINIFSIFTVKIRKKKLCNEKKVRKDETKQKIYSL